MPAKKGLIGTTKALMIYGPYRKGSAMVYQVYLPGQRKAQFLHSKDELIKYLQGAIPN